MPKTPDQINPLEETKKEEEIETQPIEEEILNLVEENTEEKKENLKNLAEKTKEREQQQIESVREQIAEKIEKDDSEKDTDLIKRMRLPRNFDSRPVELTKENKDLISDMAIDSAKRLEKNYEPGFGVFPCFDPKENFYNQIWTRDLGHAAGNYFVIKEPKAAADSLNTIFKFQRDDGMLPFRVEKVYGLLKVLPGLKIIAQPLFNLIQKRIKGVHERPRYEH